MGNKMSCLCCAEKEEEEIYMEVLNRGEVLEENSEVSDSGEYLEMIENPQPLYDVPYDHNPPKTIRFRISAKHYQSATIEYRVHYESTILLNPNIDIESIECLIHVSVFNNRYERIKDLTYINDLSSDTIKERILYSRNLEEDTWTLTHITDDDQNPQNEIQFRSVENVLVWALTTHKQQGSKVKKELFLSEKPATIIVPVHMRESVECIIHIISSNLHMKKIFEMFIVRAKRQRFPAEYYIQWKGRNMDIPCCWCYTDHRDV